MLCNSQTNKSSTIIVNSTAFTAKTVKGFSNGETETSLVAPMLPRHTCHYCPTPTLSSPSSSSSSSSSSLSSSPPLECFDYGRFDLNESACSVRLNPIPLSWCSSSSSSPFIIIIISSSVSWRSCSPQLCRIVIPISPKYALGLKALVLRRHFWIQRSVQVVQHNS